MSCLGTESIDPEDLSSLICLNPNPANHEVVVSSCASISVVEVYSAVGGLVFSSSDSQEIIQKDVNTIFLDVKGWSRGTYLLRIQTPMGVVTKKLLVQ